jgi:hypothetical protein
VSNGLEEEHLDGSLNGIDNVRNAELELGIHAHVALAIKLEGVLQGQGKHIVVVVAMVDSCCSID